jgi:WD40 repeat protein
MATSVVFSLDSKHIVSGLWDKTIRIWDAETGDITAGSSEGHKGCVTFVAFSPDSKRIVSARELASGTLRLEAS